MSANSGQRIRFIRDVVFDNHAGPSWRLPAGTEGLRLNRHGHLIMLDNEIQISSVESKKFVRVSESTGTFEVLGES